MLEICAPLQSHIVQCLVQPGDAVTAGQLLMVLEAMKMEHEITAPMEGEIRALHFSEGEAVSENDVLVTMQRSVSPSAPSLKHEPIVNPSTLRSDLTRLQRRLEHTLDVNR
ncbi:MAG: acetyl-CoA carboxylase biotin carboxyl carrier protein subunit, partial [Sulfuritalea sp.]|nr:acetyl-CoA carboxylase biotin carboxyl carrier protein subunit [Sulfuritalea sp.]